MVVRGDGTLIRAEVALEYPVETVLSGPAASVVGAGFLSGLADFAVADMGGTTTDVAIVAQGRPVVRPEGAVLGGWRTMVRAIDVHTCGLGGDSEVYFDRDMRLRVGPRRTVPLSLLATQFPQVLGDLRKLAASERVPPFAARFALRNPGRDPDVHLDRLERRVWDGLGASPRPLGEVARTAVAAEAVRRLVDRGLATLAAFTPSDALHVLGPFPPFIIKVETKRSDAFRYDRRLFPHSGQGVCPLKLIAIRAEVPGGEALNGGTIWLTS